MHNIWTVYTCLLQRTTGVDNADSRCFPDEVIRRFLRFRARMWKHDAVVGSQSESEWTVEYREVLNIICGNDTVMCDMTWWGLVGDGGDVSSRWIRSTDKDWSPHTIERDTTRDLSVIWGVNSVVRQTDVCTTHRLRVWTTQSMCRIIIIP